MANEQLEAISGMGEACGVGGSQLGLGGRVDEMTSWGGKLAGLIRAAERPSHRAAERPSVRAQGRMSRQRPLQRDCDCTDSDGEAIPRNGVVAGSNVQVPLQGLL